MANGNGVGCTTGVLQINLSNIGSWPASIVPNTIITISAWNVLVGNVLTDQFQIY